MRQPTCALAIAQP